jgi:acyl-CoA synthetase (NDP forming)
VRLPDLSEAAVEVLTRDLPEETYPTNPIDTGGSWVQPDKSEVFPATLSVFASESDVDVVVSRFTIPRTGELGVLRERIAELEAARSAHPDRLFPVLSRTCGQYCDEWETVIRERRIPFLQGYGRGLRALGLMAEYSRAVHGSAGPTAGERTHPPRNESDVATDLAPESAVGARMLDDGEARELLATVGIAVQPSATTGLEIVIGAHRDAQFGPVITFGLGGELGEVLDDVALRLAPVSEEEAAAMLLEIRGHRLLDGGRNRPAVDRAAIRDALCALAGLMLSRPDVAWVRLDPAVVNAKGLTATHAHVQLSGD